MSITSRKAVATLLVSFSVWALTACSSGGSNSSGVSQPTTPVVTPVATPTVASISPAKLAAGVADTSLTITGTNFTSTSAVQVGSVIEPTTYVSATQLTATISASQLTSGSSLAVIVLNGTSTSASGTAMSLEVDNPVPTITSFTPSSLSTGSVAMLVSVTGTGFVPTTTVQINGSARSATYVGSTQINVILTVADLASSGSLTLTAVNTAPGGGTSAAASLPINNPLPRITMLSPEVVTAGATTPATITVTGTNFMSGTTVMVEKAAHAATIVSATQLTFALTAAEQAVAGLLEVTLTNPAPGGGISNTRDISIATPTLTPTISSVNPTTFVVGSPATQIQVTGTNLDYNSTVEWNGSALTSSYSFGNAVYATVPASLLAATGTATITVSNATAVTPVSNSLTVTITNPPVPTITALQPNYGPINTDTSISLNGTGFTPASAVSLNGTALTTTYNNANSLSVSVPASSIALPGNYSFTVTTPAPGGGTSTPLAFSAYIPLVSNSMVYNSADGLFYASIPSSVGAPLGNSIVSVDPATGATGTPIFVGSEPNKLALTADGHYLWVGLDGASAVRKVDLVARTAGLQFSLPAVNSGVYNPPATPQALAALPGATDSVIVALSNSNYGTDVGLSIFDAGVARPNSASNTNYNSQVLSIQVDGSKTEVYTGGPGSYNTYTYDSNGLTAKATLPNLGTTNGSQDEIQLLSGKIFTDLGQVYDAEAGALLGSLYVSGQTIAQGATLADSTLGKIFVVDNSTASNSSGSDQIQLFKLSDYSSTGVVIPVNIPSSLPSFPYINVYPTRLSRWGANGLAVHTPFGIYSLQSNSVLDLSSTVADLGVTLTTSGATTTGGTTTFTASATNSGPSTASDVVLTATSPAIGTLTSATATAGTCGMVSGISCSLGSLASGGTVTVTINVLQTVAGASTVNVQVAGSTADGNVGNNATNATATITGATYSVTPALSSIAPAAIEAGAADTTITLNGTGFNAASTALLGSTSLTTTFVSSTQLTATVPAASVATLGWAPVTVTTPAPGGGTSAPLPLTVFSVITIGVNHILYDPYSRQIMASVGAGSSSVNGNSIATIDPATATIGNTVSIGSQPTNLALSSDGQILYTNLSGSQSVARYKMLSGQADFTYTVPLPSNFYGGIALRGIAVQPGSEDTIALDLGSSIGNAIYDFDPGNKTAAVRGQPSGIYSGSCISFLDAADLIAFNTDSFPTLNHYTVTSSGFQNYNYSQYTTSTLKNFGCFKLSGDLAFANGGGIADPSPAIATQIAVLPGVNGQGYPNSPVLAPDASLKRAFYPAVNGLSYYNGTSADGITAFDLNTYLPTATLPLNMPAIEGTTTSYSQVDMVRWGQDGLAILTSTGHIYLLRGAAIVPGLLGSTGTASSLTSASSTTLAAGSGNVLLTLTGSKFAPGVAVTWNGSYRTTTIVDQTHVTVAIPASDLVAAGSGSLVATNPGGPASNAISVSVQ